MVVESAPTIEEIRQRAQWRYGAWWFLAGLLILGLIIDLRLLLFAPGFNSHPIVKIVVGGVLLAAIATTIGLATHNERIAKGHVAPRSHEFVELTAARKRARSTTVVVVLIVLLLPFGIFVLVVSHSQHARSVETQQHGILVSGTVTAVDDETHCSRYTCTTNSNLTVALDHPVLGRRTTTVHDPDTDDQLKGQRDVPVFVDPKEPSYAELPGEPLVGDSLFYAALGVSVFFFGTFVIAVVSEMRVWRRRRGRQPVLQPAGP